MEQHVTVADVQRLLPNLTIPSEDAGYVESLVDEAIDLIRAYCRGGLGSGLPEEVKRVAARMVARVLQAPEPSFAVETLSQTAGAFSQSQKFTTGASGGSPWLTAADKTVLSRFRKRRGFYSISMV